MPGNMEQMSLVFEEHLGPFGTWNFFYICSGYEILVDGIEPILFSNAHFPEEKTLFVPVIQFYAFG